jgi:hypothetical protein
LKLAGIEGVYPASSGHVLKPRDTYYNIKDLLNNLVSFDIYKYIIIK